MQITKEESKSKISSRGSSATSWISLGALPVKKLSDSRKNCASAPTSLLARFIWTVLVTISRCASCVRAKIDQFYLLTVYTHLSTPCGWVPLSNTLTATRSWPLDKTKMAPSMSLLTRNKVPSGLKKIPRGARSSKIRPTCLLVIR